jgi:hypothetical protein
MNVAHRDGGDEIAVQHRGAGERQAVAADHAAFGGLRETGRERRELMRLFALVAGHRARERIEQNVLAVFARALRDVFVLERGRELREHRGGFACHYRLLHCSPRRSRCRLGRLMIRRAASKENREPAHVLTRGAGRLS